MAITNIESTGFNSLFLASSRLGRQAIDANVPTQKEKNLNSANRSLKIENSNLTTENRLLTEENQDLSKDNKFLSKQVDRVQAESQAEKGQDLKDISKDSGSDIYSHLEKGENFSKNSEDLSAASDNQPRPPRVADVPVQRATPPVSYNASSELLGDTTSGSSFNLQV